MSWRVVEGEVYSLGQKETSQAERKRRIKAGKSTELRIKGSPDYVSEPHWREQLPVLPGMLRRERRHLQSDWCLICPRVPGEIPMAQAWHGRVSLNLKGVIRGGQETIPHSPALIKYTYLGPVTS